MHTCTHSISSIACGECHTAQLPRVNHSTTQELDGERMGSSRRHGHEAAVATPTYHCAHVVVRDLHGGCKQSKACSQNVCYARSVETCVTRSERASQVKNMRPRLKAVSPHCSPKQLEQTNSPRVHTPSRTRNMEKKVTRNSTHSVAFSDTTSRDTFEPSSHGRIASL